MKSKQLFNLFLFAVISVNTAFAQVELFRTMTGHLFIKADLNDTAVSISSSELFIMLDYETGKIVMKQKVASLITENDSIQSKLNGNKDVDLKFVGQLGLDYIDTSDHPPLDFQVEGTLFPQNIQIIGTGHLEHITEKGTNVCLLSLDFVLDPKIVFPNNEVPGLHNNIYVKVLQSLLSRVND